MSSIIDALKKSDNNRTNESGAHINQIKFGNESPPKSRRGFWLLVLFLLLFALGTFAWTQGWHHSALAQVQSWFGSEPTNPIDSQPSNAAIKQKETEKKAKPNNKLTPPKAEEVKAKSLAADEAESDTKRKQQLEVIAARESKALAEKTDDSDVDLTAQGEIIPVQADDPNHKGEAKETTKQAELMAKQDRQDLEPSMKQEYLLIHQIDFELRKNIPPVKLNVHIYDPEPENRMVILNGVKYNTGDIIEDLVSVEEINQEGVVLKFENINFLIPK